LYKTGLNEQNKITKTSHYRATVKTTVKYKA